MIISDTEFTVRYAETDQMGIVHHSNYPVWFEAGRTDFIKKLGISYTQMEQSGILLPLIELRCNYKSYAKYEDRIVVRTRIKELTCTRIIFYYEVFRNNGSSPITIGETTHVWTDKNIKPLNIRKFRPDLYELVLKAV